MIERGQLLEEKAAHFLKDQGLRIYMRNFRCKLGELDIIALDGDTVVFIEVRYRASTAFGGPLASITASKQQKLIRTAQYFLQGKRVFHNASCRFDVIAMSGDVSQPTLEWIKNAIYL